MLISINVFPPLLILCYWITNVNQLPYEWFLVTAAFTVFYFQLDNKAMLTVYRIAFVPARKPYWIELLFTHNNGDFGAILKGAKLHLVDL